MIPEIVFCVPFFFFFLKTERPRKTEAPCQAFTLKTPCASKTGELHVLTGQCWSTPAYGWVEMGKVTKGSPGFLVR